MSSNDKQALLAKVVHIAQGEIGQVEVPRGSNWGLYVKGVLAAVGIGEPAPWCQAFVVYACQKAGAMGNLIATGLVQAQVNHARETGMLVSADDIKSGKVTLLPGWQMAVWEPQLTPPHYAHAGIVETVLPDGAFTSIEGNTNDDGGREGYAVMRHTRKVSDTASGHNKYAFIMTA